MYCYYCMKESTEQNGCCAQCGRSYEPDPDRSHLTAGTLLKEKYMIGRVLGQGGFGITYIGLDVELERRIAVKEYYPQGYASRDALASNEVKMPFDPENKIAVYLADGQNRLLTEAKILAKFNRSGNIVHVHDFFKLNNTAYIIMDFVEGNDLKHFLKNNGRIEPQTLVNWFMPILEVLGKVHAEGLIHRDISPDNIIVENGNLILIDFGAARDVETSRSLSIMLKPGYAPAEQYVSDPSQQGAWTDIYAVCATMYECITGIMPQESSSRTFGDKLQPPSAFGIMIPPQIEAALMHGMAVSYKDRPQTMQQLIDELKGIAPVPAFDPKTVCMDDPDTVLMTANTANAVADVEVGRLTTVSPQQTGELTREIAAQSEPVRKGRLVLAACAALALVIFGGIGIASAASRRHQPDDIVAAETTEAAMMQTGTETLPESGIAVSTDMHTTSAVTSAAAEEKRSETAEQTTASSGRITAGTVSGTNAGSHSNANADNNTPSERRVQKQQGSEGGNGNTSHSSEPDADTPAEGSQNGSQPAEIQSDFLFENIGNGCMITGMRTNMQRLDIPQMIGDMPVLCIGNNAFANCADIISVTMPDSIETIGENAFADCTMLEEIRFSGNLKSIGAYAFAGTGLYDIALPESLREIGEGAFYEDGGFEQIRLPYGVESVGDYAFAQCDMLTDIYIPVTVKQIGICAFMSDPPTPHHVEFGGSASEWDNNAYSETAFALDESDPDIYYNVRPEWAFQ